MAEKKQYASDNAQELERLWPIVQEAQETDRLFMSFSAGVDSIAMWLRIMEAEIIDPKDAVLYYYYYIPGISWVEEWIEYFEDLYGVKVIQVPSEAFLHTWGNWQFQTPARAEAIVELQTTDYSIQKMSKQEIQDAVREWAGLPETAYCAVGVKSGDSARRRMAMRKSQGVNHNNRKWYPIWDYERGDPVRMVQRHGIKVPYDYELFGISFENIDYRFAKVMKERCPQNWARVKEFFPMAETIITRYEYYHPEWKAKKGEKHKKFEVLEPRRPL